MLKYTLLKTLFYEMEPSHFPDLQSKNGNDPKFHTLHLTYESAPSIRSITTEQRYLPYSVLYYIWVNDEKKEADLNNPELCQWILSFFREFHPEFLKEEISDRSVHGLSDLLNCFEVDRIPAYNHKYAYSDLTFTTMKDIKNGTTEKDTRQATLPGLRFADKYRKNK